MAPPAPNAGDKAPPEYYDIVDRAILATARPLNRWINSVVPAPYNGSATPGAVADPSPVPNILTLISIVIGIAAAAVVARKGPRSAAGALFMLAYFFDCADGQYARMYNSATTLGDKLDHYGDALKWVLMGTALVYASGVGYAAYASHRRWALLAVAATFAYMLTSMGCLQKYALCEDPNRAPEMLDVLTPICIDWAPPCTGGVLLVLVSGLIATDRL